MELGKQIKKYRGQVHLSQEEFAEQLFVSRQTVSNWENDKSYPDIKSLLLMSEIFHISLDQLVKGDIEKMKREIDAQEFGRFQKDSTIFSVLLIAMFILPVPLALAAKWAGIALYVCLSAVGMYYAIRVEKYKKKYDIQTFKEIIAFTEGKELSEIEKATEAGKRPYQKALLAAGSGALALVIGLVIAFIAKMLG